MDSISLGLTTKNHKSNCKKRSQEHFGTKTADFAPKKKENLRQRQCTCPCRHHSWMMMRDAPPAPSPPPSPSKTPTFWACWSVSRMGGAGVRSEIAGADYPHLDPPSSGAIFFGARQRKGDRGRPYDVPTPRLFSPPPHPLSSAIGAPTAPVAPARGRGGGKYEAPTPTQPPALSYATPVAPLTPTACQWGFGDGGLVTTLHPNLATLPKDLDRNSMGAVRDTLAWGDEERVKGCHSLLQSQGLL